ncbi:MAG: hypothetical protein JXB03_03740 [Spirochaetales bacterium]|nr:hypothetical protein [Spirochaetales bacterium]
MTAKRMLPGVCGVWELFRLVILSFIMVLALNPEGDGIVSALILLAFGPNLILPLMMFGLSSLSTSGTAVSLAVIRIVKGWSLIWEGILALLLSAAGVILLSFFEYLFQAKAVYRIFSSDVYHRIPSTAVSIVFWLDLIFFFVILLYKQETSRNSLGTQDTVAATLPEAEVLGIEEDE